MKITWDQPKRATNIAENGLDLVDAERFGWDRATVTPTYSGPDGRPRFKAIGILDDDLVALVFSPLGGEAIASEARPIRSDAGTHARPSHTRLSWKAAPP